MFCFDLSIALQIPVHEIKAWPISLIDQYKAFNHIKPFTKNVEQELTGFIIEILRNQNITKKSQYKTAHEIMPFLAGKLPKQLDDPRLIKLREQLSFAYLPQEAITDMCKSIAEEVHIQTQMEEKDQYFISELIKLYQKYNKNNKEE